MAENKINTPAEETEEDSIITLTDEDGKQARFEYLDMIEYSGHNYAVLLPADTPEDEDGEVIIFSIEDEDDEMSTLEPVKDPSLARAIFGLFKEKNAEYFDFV